MKIETMASPINCNNLLQCAALTKINVQNYRRKTYPNL